MTLDQYLIKTGETNAGFGARINITGETVRRYRIGLRFPEPEVMQDIINITGGQVTANDWFELPAQSEGGRAA